MMTDIPAADESSIGARLAIMGAAMQLAPFIGMAATVWGMMRAFRNLSDSGISDPATLTQSIGGVLIATALGILVGIVGVVLMLVARFALGYRPRWLTALLVAVGVFWLVMMPSLSYMAAKKGTADLAF